MLQVKKSIPEIVFKRICNYKIIPYTFPTSLFPLGQIYAKLLKKACDSFYLHFSTYKLPTKKYMQAMKPSAGVRLRQAGLPLIKSHDPYCAKGLSTNCKILHV